MSNTPETDETEPESIAAYIEAYSLHASKLARERDEAREQQDRLAAALVNCREDSMELLAERDWWQNEPRLDYKKRYQENRDNIDRADLALQSLNQNSQDQDRR